MAESSRIRSFVAVDLEQQVLEVLRVLQAELARAGADVRWVRPTGMHVTLKFLGAVETARLERVHAALREAVPTQPVTHLRVRGLGAFPSLRRPRVVWAGLVGDGMVALATCVEQALKPLGFPAEKRPFAPHVTLGRVKSMRGWERLEEALKAHLDDDCGATIVDRVVIYRSTLHRDGAVYALLWTIRLGRNKTEPTNDVGS